MNRKRKHIKRPCLVTERGLTRSPECTGDRGANRYLCKFCLRHNTESGVCEGDFIYTDKWRYGEASK